MNYLTENTEKLDIIPDFDNNLIDSLVGYETITAYNQALRLINFKKIINEKIKKHGNRAIDTINYWMKNVETPFTKTFVAIKELFLEDDTLKDLAEALNKYVENPTVGNKREINEISGAYKKILSEQQTYITVTNNNVDTFRQQLSEDSTNFQEINKELPKIINDNNAKIIEKKDKIQSTHKKITDLTTDIRKKHLEIEEINDDIYKAGIVCAIPILNLGGSIAMAVLLGKKSTAYSELRKLEDGLEEKTTEIVTLNSELDTLNSQAPILTSLCSQIPNLFSLSMKSAEIAQSIKRSWDDIGSNLENIDHSLNDSKDIENLSNYVKKNLSKKLMSRQATLKKIIEKYERSQSLGIPIGKDAQRAFNLGSRLGSRYYYNKHQSGLLYIPAKELNEVITKIRARY